VRELRASGGASVVLEQTTQGQIADDLASRSPSRLDQVVPKILVSALAVAVLEVLLDCAPKMPLALNGAR